MRKFSLWLRAHPVVGDSVLAVLLFFLDFGAGVRSVDEIPVWAFYGAGVLLTAPLALRRKWPIPACWALVLGALLQVCTHGSIVPTLSHGETVYTSTGPIVRLADLSLPIALYTMVVYTRRKQALLYLVALLAGTALWEVWRIHLWNESIAMLCVFVLMLTCCWALGEMVGARRAYHGEVEQRVKLLETERDQQARIAVGEERTRIARELHDVVAHAVSVIVVQADGAAYSLRSHPEIADGALHTISTTGRDALAELRRMLGVLRDEKSEEARAGDTG